MSSAGSSDDLRLRIVDAVCDQFERNWKTGRKPHLSTFVEPFGGRARAVVFEELLRIDLELRCRCGESPEADTYRTRYPEFVEQVGRVFEEGGWSSRPAAARSNDHLLALVRSIPPFDETPAEVVGELLDGAAERTWPTDAHLLRQGERTDALLLLTEGVAEVVHSSPLGDRPVTRVGPGTILGEISILTGEACTAHVVARGSVTGLVVPRERVEEVSRRHPALTSALYELVSLRIGLGLRDILYDRRVGDYRVLECIGRGGAGVVYKGVHHEARDDDPAGLVALKLLHHSHVTNHKSVGRFRQEAEIGRRLDHPNIVRARDVLPAFGTQVMVQDYCDGRSLDEELRDRGRFEADELRRVVGQIAAALEHAHARGVLHHDVTPGNVMLSGDGTARLTDFGLARVGELDDLTAEQAIVGTPAYMPPECFGLGPLTPAADVYGLGCVTLELWTGRMPVVGRTLMETMSLRSSWSLPPREEITPVPDEELYHFLDLCLRYNPAERTVDLAQLARWAR